MSKPGFLSVCLTISLLAALCLPAGAADSPGTFVFSPESNEVTYNRWASEGYVLKKILVDYFDNDVYDLVYEYEFDDANRLTKLKIDYDYNGVFDTVDKYTYNDDGRISRVDINEDNDGPVDAVVYYYYNDDNTTDYQEIDLQNNGTIDEVTTYVYVDGKLERKLFDLDNDGFANSVIRYTWQGDFWSTAQSDSDNDGTGDFQERYVYDNETGNISLVAIDEDYDTVDDYAGAYFYHADGYLEQFKVDNDNDGIFDIVETYVWTFNDTGDDNPGANDTDDSSSSASCFLGCLTR